MGPLVYVERERTSHTGWPSHSRPLSDRGRVPRGQKTVEGLQGRRQLTAYSGGPESFFPPWVPTFPPANFLGFVSKKPPKPSDDGVTSSLYSHLLWLPLQSLSVVYTGSLNLLLPLTTPPPFALAPTFLIQQEKKHPKKKKTPQPCSEVALPQRPFGLLARRGHSRQQRPPLLSRLLRMFPLLGGIKLRHLLRRKSAPPPRLSVN